MTTNETMTDLAEIAEMARTLAGAMGDSLSGFGGFLRCETCGKQTPLGDPGEKVAHGWPKCCDHTMRWWTQSQIDAGEVPGVAAPDTEGRRGE